MNAIQSASVAAIDESSVIAGQEADLKLQAIIIEYTTGYNLVVGTTLLLWDILVTLPRERSYIWSRKFNLITFFYLITRYLPIVVTVFFLIFQMKYPGGYFGPVDFGRWQAILIYVIPWFVVLICTELLFIRRTVAMYGNSGLLWYTLTGLFICEMLVAMVSFWVFYKKGEFGSGIQLEDAPSGVTSMVLFSLDHAEPALSYTLPELIFQAILILLVLNRAISNYRYKISSGNLISVVIRDGIWSYLLNLCGLLLTLINPSWSRSPSVVGQPSIQWSYITFSITSSRLLLNIRAAARNPSGLDTVTLQSTLNNPAGYLQPVRSFLMSGIEELSTSMVIDYDSDVDQ